MAAKPKIYSVAIELTAQCNQKCSYCYNGWRADNGASMEVADTDELVGRTRKLLDAIDVDHVTLTGGEPFSRPDVWSLLDLLQERGLRAQIISNGGLITERLAARLAPYRPLYVQVTLNGHTRELHEEHVGEGHFERTLRGIEALTKHGVPVVGCVVVTHKNAPVLGQILELWHSLGVRHIALSRFSPAGYATEHAAELLPSLPDIEAAFEQARPYHHDKGMRLSCTMPIPPCMLEYHDYDHIEIGSCPIGTAMQELSLGPDGSLRNCTLHRDKIGGVADILAADVDVAALLEHPDRAAYRDKLPSFCEGCLHAGSCGGGCGAAAEWVLGLDEAGRRRPDPFLWQHVDDGFDQRLQDERRRHLAVVT